MRFDPAPHWVLGHHEPYVVQGEFFTMNGIVLGITDEAQSVWYALEYLAKPTTVLDILIVALIFWWLYKFLSRTRAIQIVYGILILLVLWGLGQLLQLTALNFILKYSIIAILIAFPIVFQPELRSALERLGRARFVTELYQLRRNEILDLIEKITKTVTILSKQKIGALIVIGRQTGLKEFIETGTKIDGAISTELLVNIFAPKSNMHDGAAIISGNRIAATSCILPLSDDKFDFQLGTRHRAAVGLTSQTDALVIVVSEERGDISLAAEGLLETGLEISTLKEQLIKKLTRASRERQQNK